MLIEAGFMKKQELQVYRDKGAIGFACGHFFDAAGQIIVSEFDDRHVTMSHDDLMKVEQRICMGGGADKVMAICGLLKSKMANILILDEDTARKVLEEFSTAHN